MINKGIAKVLQVVSKKDLLSDLKICRQTLTNWLYMHIDVPVPKAKYLYKKYNKQITSLNFIDFYEEL